MCDLQKSKRTDFDFKPKSSTDLELETMVAQMKEAGFAAHFTQQPQRNQQQDPQDTKSFAHEL